MSDMTSYFLTEMANKRRPSFSSPLESSMKRQRSDLAEGKPPPVDPQSGQRHAFPGLEAEDVRDALSDDEAGEALRYLRSVR